MSEYIETLVSECPECGKEVPGHVTGDEYVGVYAWECPACETTTEPNALGWSRKVDVGEVPADA